MYAKIHYYFTSRQRGVHLHPPLPPLNPPLHTATTQNNIWGIKSSLETLLGYVQHALVVYSLPAAVMSIAFVDKQVAHPSHQCSACFRED